MHDIRLKFEAVSLYYRPLNTKNVDIGVQVALKRHMQDHPERNKTLVFAGTVADAESAAAALKQGGGPPWSTTEKCLLETGNTFLPKQVQGACLPLYDGFPD